MNRIDIIRTSASRPDFLRISTESILDKMKFSGSFRWILHEDCLSRPLSDELMKYVEGCGIYEIFHRDNPPIGQGLSLSWLMDKANNKYVINFEDDWELLKEVNVDKLCDLMDRHENINQIAFFKRPIMKNKKNFIKKQVVIDDVPLVVPPHWAFTPNIFRLSYLKPRWKNFSSNVHFEMQHVLKMRTEKEERGNQYFRDAEWMEKYVGNYYLGYIKSRLMWEAHGGPLNREEYEKIDNGHYVSHLGKQNPDGTGGSVRLGSYGKR
jgi:hypothetical protein